jgi:hypothetical protein
MDTNIRTLERKAALGDPSAVRALNRARNRAGIRTSSTDVRLSYLDRLDLAAALEADHPCDDDTACDIGAAVRAGYEEAAAHLLMGATECPTVEALLDKLDIYGGFPWPRGWEEWCEWHSENGRQCPECDAFNFAHDDIEPDYCGNCRAEFPQQEDEED